MRIPWMQRVFRFDFPWEIYPEQIARVRGTRARAAALTADVSPRDLATRVGDRWSIQENIAHLADLDEDLFLARIDQYASGDELLAAADMGNVRTNQARHNDRSLGEILDRFARTRRTIVKRLESISHDRFARSAIHPRLKVPMRLTDLVFFNAEHDDYHMAHNADLRRELGMPA